MYELKAYIVYVKVGGDTFSNQDIISARVRIKSMTDLDCSVKCVGVLFSIKILCVLIRIA